GVAALAVVAVIVPVGVRIADQNTEPVRPATTPVTPSIATQTPEPEPLLELSTHPLLRPRSLDAADPYQNFRQAQEAPPLPARYAGMCLPAVWKLTTTATAHGAWNSDVEAQAEEYVLQMPTVDTAEKLVQQHRNLPHQCGSVDST